MTRIAADRHTRRLLLIEPPFYRLYGEKYGLVKYPLSLAYLSMALKERTDWEVRILNADFAPVSAPFDITYLTGKGFRRYTENLENPAAGIWQSIRAALVEYQPSVVGISVKSSSLAAAYLLAGMVKDLNRDAIVIAGGPHPSATGPEMLGNPHIDICVAGEGEETLVDLLLAIENGKPIREVAGLFFRNGAEPEGTSRRKPLADLDTLGFPFRHARETLSGYEAYPPAAFGYLFTTRGCPYQCLFCGSREVWGRKTRFRTPQHVAGEIEYLRSMGINSFHFDDDTFGVNNAYLQNLCRTLARHCPGIEWSCEIHVQLVKEENIILMKMAGCKMIQLGIESGNNGVLAKVRKGFTIEEALAASRMITSHGIRLHTFFMAGFPWETEKTLLDTKKVIEGIECEKIIYSLFTPYPGTEAFRLCQAEGLIPERYHPSLFGHQSPNNCFCKHLSPPQFRTLSRDIEETVVKKNRAGRGNLLPGL